MSAELQALVTLSVAGAGSGGAPLNAGVWDKRTGGKPSSAPTIHRPGGMGPLQAYTSLSTFDDITLTRVWDNENRDDTALYKSLLPFVGHASCTVTEQPLDENGVAFGNPLIYTGILKDMDQGQYDSESEAARTWSIDIAVTQGS